MLYPSPGLAVFAQLPDSPIRGILRMNIPQMPTQLFAVAGGTLFEVFSNGTFVNRGNVANDGKPASMCNSNIQVMIASGGKGYCYTVATQTLSAPVATIAGAVQVGYSDGFFAALIADTAQIYVSNPLDGLTWNPSNTAIVSVYSDNAVSMIVDHREICVFGKKQTVCYYDSGNVFPYDVIPGGYAEQGSGATFGTIKADNTVMWIGEDERGHGIAWRAQGYTPQRISNHAIETIWATYSKISDAVAYSFQDQGHTFVHWYFPTANKSWRYDVATQLWHEVCYGEGPNQTAHRSWCHAFAFDKHLVGDWATGSIYQMNIAVADGAGGWTFNSDFGNPIRRVRRSPYFGTPEVWNFIKTFELEIQMGVGPEIALLSGGGYDSTFIQSTGGTSLPDYSIRLATSSTIGHTYQIGGIYKNIGSTVAVFSLSLTGGASVTQTIAAGAVGTISLSIVGTGVALRYGIGSANIGDPFTVIGFNPTAQDATAGNPILIATDFTGAWTVFGSGATITLAQGQQNPLAVQVAPQIMLRWSKDAGQTWSQERHLGIGQIGQYATRAIARRMPRFWGTKGMIIEVATSDPVPFRIIDGYIEATPGMQPIERLPHNLRKQA